MLLLQSNLLNEAFFSVVASSHVGLDRVCWFSVNVGEKKACGKITILREVPDNYIVRLGGKRKKQKKIQIGEFYCGRSRVVSSDHFICLWVGKLPFPQCLCISTPSFSINDIIAICRKELKKYHVVVSSVSPSNRKVEMVIIFVFVVCHPNHTTNVNCYGNAFERFYVKYLNSPLFGRYSCTHTHTHTLWVMSWVTNISACGSWDWYPVNECHFISGSVLELDFVQHLSLYSLNNANEIDTVLKAESRKPEVHFMHERKKRRVHEVQGRSNYTPFRLRSCHNLFEIFLTVTSCSLKKLLIE